METPDPIFPLWPLLLPRAQGLLAGLIYLDSTAAAITTFQNPHSLQSHISKQWELFGRVRAKLDESRQRLIAAMHNMYLVGLDDVLNCFVKPTHFYEAAISGYQNTLLYLPPTTVGEVLALCSLSHAIFHCAGSQISFDFSHLEIWRNAIANHNHRQLFGDLIKAAFLEPHLTSQASCSLSGLIDDGRSMQQSYQGEPSTIPTSVGNDMANGSLGSSWDLIDAIDVFLASNSPFTSQTYCSHMVNGSTQLPSTPSPDLQGSPIIRSLTHFLEDCGELTFALSSPSSRGATIQSTQCELRNCIEPLYIQRLRNDDSFKDSRVQGIVSVLDSFINLGYLQSVNEAQHYMLLLGNEILPSDDFFPSFCQSVCTGVDKAGNRTALPHNRLRRPNMNKIPCDICDEVFTRKTNMKRHVERKHPGSRIQSQPARLTKRRGTRRRNWVQDDRTEGENCGMS